MSCFKIGRDLTLRELTIRSRRCIIHQRYRYGVAAMVFIEFIWDLDEDPDGNVQHDV
jgi:hypothetical protein